MTGSWLTLSAAASRISDMTGKPVSLDDVHRLADDGLLTVSWLHDHYGVLKSSLTAYLSTLPALELDASRGALLAESRPTVRGGDPIGEEAEQDYELSRADYDTTPNDEGDDD